MKYTFIVLTLLASSASFGSGYECTDSKFTQYSAQGSDGGACCGRSTVTLSYRGNPVKTVLHIRGFRGPGTIEDSNPNIEIQEGQKRDRKDGPSNGQWIISYFKMDIELRTKDGSDPIPGKKSPSSIRMNCTERRYNGPPRP